MHLELPPMRPMDLDPTYVPYLQDLLAGRSVPIHLDDPQLRRARFAAARRPQTATDPPGVRLTHHRVDAGTHAIAVRVYRPTQPAHRPGGIVYLHGGGWMYGSAEQSEPIAARYCREVGAVVVSPDYRLTPEHPFPAGFDDCFAVLRWFVETAASFGFDSDRVAITGESSGANLAAACAIEARDQSGPALRLQVLHYPALDVDFATASYRENEHAPVLSAAEMRYFWSQYLPDGPHGADDRALPLRADLHGVAPALITTAEYDPLRDDGIAYVERLRQAGVPVDHLTASRLPHGFLRAWAVSEDVAHIGEAVVHAFRRHLEPAR